MAGPDPVCARVNERPGLPTVPYPAASDHLKVSANCVPHLLHMVRFRPSFAVGGRDCNSASSGELRHSAGLTASSFFQCRNLEGHREVAAGVFHDLGHSPYVYERRIQVSRSERRDVGHHPEVADAEPQQQFCLGTLDRCQGRPVRVGDP